MDVEHIENRENGNGQALAKKKKSVIRHLDHLADMTRGTHFTQIPEPLRSAWYDRVIHPEKMRFIGIMIGQASEFHVKRQYLENRFDPRTIKKYLAELVEDGLLRLEKITQPNGRPAVIHHVNPIRFWQLRELKNPTLKNTKKKTKAENASFRPPVPLQDVPLQDVPLQDVPLQDVPLQGLNETNLIKPIKSNQFNGGGNSTGFTSRAHSRLIQFTRDHFDASFAVKGQGRKGFDYEEANIEVAGVIDAIGYEAAEVFATWLYRYKTYNRRSQIKPKEVSGLLQKFQNGMEPNGSWPTGELASRPEPSGLQI